MRTRSARAFASARGAQAGGVLRPIEQGDWNMAYLFPHEVAAARARTGLVILPMAPIEWHGPHLAMGCDNLLAHAFARALARELRSPYYPPLFIGTERERPPRVLRSIGFKGGEFIEGMDFPANPVASAYYREEVFAAVVRDTLDILLGRMRFRRVLLVNGHGAVNQKEVLDRLCSEFNAGLKRGKRVMWVYPSASAASLGQSLGHADAGEASMLAAVFPGCVDLSRLPRRGRLKNTAFAIVDSETFDCSPTRDRALRAERDPRTHTDAEQGKRLLAEDLKRTLRQVRRTLLRE